MSAFPALVAATPGVGAGFVLVLARVAGTVMTAPVFGATTVPLRIRAAIAFFVAVCLLPAASPPDAFVGPAPSGLALLVALGIETVIGIAIGLVAQFLFAGVMLAGELAGVEMGLGIGGLIDPQMQARTTAIAEWQHVIAILVLLAIDAHHVVLRAVAESFARLPLAAHTLSGEGFAAVIVLAGAIFVVALKIAAPVLILVLMANFAMAALARLIPQLNVMAVGFPVNIAAGFLALALAQPSVIRILLAGFSSWEATFTGLISALR